MLIRTAVTNFRTAIVALIFAMVGFALPAQSTLVLDVGPGGDADICGVGDCGNVSGLTFGWAFDVTSPILVGGIAAWDSNEQAFGPDVEAGLWTDAACCGAAGTGEPGPLRPRPHGLGVGGLPPRGGLAARPTAMQ